LSSQWVRRVGPDQATGLTPLIDAAQLTRSGEFRPLFGDPAPEPPLTPPAVAEPSAAEEEEEAPQADVQRMSEEWAARLAEVDQVLRQAHQRAEALARQAEAEGYEVGYSKGYAEGSEAARHLLDQEIAQVRQVADAARLSCQQMLQHMEGEVVALVLAIARKILGDAALQREATIVDTVHRAVARLGQQGPYRIRLNPRDAEFLSARWQTRDELDGAQWELVPDERIGVGGCILECGAATVDARIETQFELVRRALMGLQETDFVEEAGDGSAA
jgi:flagellar assembly protein FliH